MLLTIQVVKKIFDKYCNFLASTDIKVLVTYTYLFAMLLMIDLALFYTQGVLFSIPIYIAASDWPRTFLHPGCFCLAYHYFLEV